MIFFDLVEDFFVRGAFGGVKDAEVRHHQHLAELFAQRHLLQRLCDPGVGAAGSSFGASAFFVARERCHKPVFICIARDFPPYNRGASRVSFLFSFGFSRVSFRLDGKQRKFEKGMARLE